MRWAGHTARMGEGRGVYRIFVVSSPKRPLGGPTRRLEIGIDGATWIRLAQDRVQWRAFVNMVMISIKKAGYSLIS
jgi:hypothetical protein